MSHEPAHDHEAPVLTAHRANLIGCRGCGRAWPLDQRICSRCHSELVPPDRRSLQKVWAWWLVGLIFYIPANLMPMLITSTFGGLKGGQGSTILGGVIELIHYGSYGIAGVVFFASIMVPVSKFFAIAWLALSAGKPATVDEAHHRLYVYEVVEFIGRWSMIDVFIVAILSALVQLGFVATIQPGHAAACFALSVASTMLAAQSFDPRLIWRGLPLRNRSKKKTT